MTNCYYPGHCSARSHSEGLPYCSCTNECRYLKPPTSIVLATNLLETLLNIENHYDVHALLHEDANKRVVISREGFKYSIAVIVYQPRYETQYLQKDGTLSDNTYYFDTVFDAVHVYCVYSLA